MIKMLTVAVMLLAVVVANADTLTLRATEVAGETQADVIIFSGDWELWGLALNTDAPKYKLGHRVNDWGDDHLTILAQWAPKPSAFSITPEYVFKVPVVGGVVSGCVGVNIPVNSHSKVSSYSPGINLLWGEEMQVGMAATFNWPEGQGGCVERWSCCVV